MTLRHLISAAALVIAPIAAIAYNSSSPPQTSERAVAQSIKDAVSGGSLTKIEGGDYKIDRSIRLPGSSPQNPKADTEVLYQIGTDKKTDSAVFLPVRTTPKDSAETAKLIDQALSHMTSPPDAVQIQACVGDRTCVKVCGTGPGEYCCKWKCEKSK